jgi:hypothetical protein
LAEGVVEGELTPDDVVWRSGDDWKPPVELAGGDEGEVDAELGELGAEDTRPDDVRPDDAGPDDAGPDDAGPDDVSVDDGDSSVGDNDTGSEDDCAEPVEEVAAGVGPCELGGADIGSPEPMTVKVAVVSVEIHTGGFVTVRKISPVTEKIPCAVIDV